MAVSTVIFLIFSHIAISSGANYCICNDGLSGSVLQTNIDYACGAGADCTPILQNGACFQPNTVKDHCNYAVNSYYQRQGQVVGSCSFSNTATVTQTLPQTAPGCVYPSNPSSGGSTPLTPTPLTPRGSPNGTGTPIVPFPGSNTPNFNIAPNTGFDNNSNGAGVTILNHNSILITSFLALLISLMSRAI